MESNCDGKLCAVLLVGTPRATDGASIQLNRTEPGYGPPLDPVGQSCDKESHERVVARVWSD